MIWNKIRLALTFFFVIIVLIEIDNIYDNFDNSVMRRNVEKEEKHHNIAFSFCTNFYNIYVNCLHNENTTKFICSNLTDLECSRVLFEATQTSYTIFNLIKTCNLMTLLDVEQKSKYDVYLNFGLVCNLKRKRRNSNSTSLSIRFNNLKKYSGMKIFIYIHEYSTIPEYFNHYIFVFDTNVIKGSIKLIFDKKIIYRHLNNKKCQNYGKRFKSRDHCAQSCERELFNYNYYKFLYLYQDNVTMFSGSRNELHKTCFDCCPIRCDTYFFDKIEVIKYSIHSNDTNRLDNQLEIDYLDFLLLRNKTLDNISLLIINRGILLTNILTIASILIGFNFFILNNLLNFYFKKYQIDKFSIGIDLNKFINCLIKFGILIGFVVHVYSVLLECSNSKYFETAISRKNDFVRNLTITFCFELSKLINNEQLNDTLNEYGYLDYKKFYLNPELTNSIDQLISKILIYSKDCFKDKKILDSFLLRNSEHLFYDEFKCWKINFNFISLTDLIMNTNLIKFTTLNNYIKFKFNKSYDQVYFSEYNLYPFSNHSFDKKKYFRKIIKIYGDEFLKDKKCLNYPDEENLKCGSQGECQRECYITTILRKYDIYPTNFKYLPKYKNEFNISEDTKFLYVNSTYLSKKLVDDCDKKFSKPNCREVQFAYKINKIHNDYQKYDDQYYLDLSFDEEIILIDYSFKNVQIIIYLTNLLYIYFGCSFSGLLSLFARTKFIKLNQMKLIFIFTIIFIEFNQLIKVYFEKKLIFESQFDTTEEMNIPKVTVCYKILEILKDQDFFDTDLVEESKIMPKIDTKNNYYLYLNEKSKAEIDIATYNLSDLFESITFLANDFGTYSVLTKESLNSLENLGKFNSLTLTTYIHFDLKCYSFFLNFKTSSNEIFDLDFIIRFQPNSNSLFFHIYSQKFLTTKDLIEIQNSTLIKFTPYIVSNKLFEKDCEAKSDAEHVKKINEIRKKFYDVFGCITTFLASINEFKNGSICNNNFKDVEDEIIRSFNFEEEICMCCKRYDFKMTTINTKPFVVVFAHSGYKFIGIYKLRLTFIELLTYLISIPSILLGINLFKIIKILWIKFLA